MEFVRCFFKYCSKPEDYIKSVAGYFKTNGLLSLGYDTFGVDDGWFVAHDNVTGAMIENRTLFPSGMKGLGTWMRSNGFRYGLYSCRGTKQCGEEAYNAEGSYGREAADVAWMVDAGARFLKIDSCWASSDHGTAFKDYGKWRDAMNASGTAAGEPVWFSVCGWNNWYSPPDATLSPPYGGGGSLGNSWRIANDGQDWHALSNAINAYAQAAPFSGPGGWADPDLLIGPQVQVGGQSDVQARAQFTLWAIFPANLIISQDVLSWSTYALETYSNAELIAINKDPLMEPARRLAGGDLQFPCRGQYTAATAALPCQPSPPPAQLWRPSNATGSAATGSALLTFESLAFPGALLTSSVCNSGYDGLPAMVAGAGENGACPNGASKHWQRQVGPNASEGSLWNNGQCLEVGRGGAAPMGGVDTAACTGAPNQAWVVGGGGGGGGGITLTSTSPSSGDPVCLTAQAFGDTCTNVWGRRLAGGAFALAFLNNDALDANVTCSGECFAALNIPPTVTQLRVRDLWAHTDVGVLQEPFEFTVLVPAGGAAAAFKLTPA